MTIRFDGYIDKEGSVSLTTPKWLVDRVSKAVEEEYDVIMVNEGEGKTGNYPAGENCTSNEREMNG